jgi:dihydrodipicolinate synthase/N-acetylneuraminate lyase
MTRFEPKTGLRGIVASLHTPFTDDDAVDTASVIRLIEHCAGAGCCGVLVAAVAGEVGSLEPAELAGCSTSWRSMPSDVSPSWRA